jgi:pSer/pThr/pTyr-binding forkhead associated (FHA) protein
MSVVGLLVDRKHPERRFDIAKPTVTIGRTQSADVVIDHNTVSRQHATIKLEEGQFRLYDLGSTNGTFLGQQQVREPVTLEDGATVRFGEVECVFKIVSLDT